MSKKVNLINHTANSLAKRENICLLVRFISAAMLCGIGLSAAVIIAGKFWLFPVSIVTTIILIIGFTVGLTRALTLRISPMKALIKAENMLGLKERLSSALVLSRQDKLSHMAELQLEDASQYCQSIDPKILCSNILTIPAKLLPIFTILLVSLAFIPAWYADPYYVSPEVQQGIKEAVSMLDQKLDEINNEPLSKKAKELVSEAKAAARSMQSDTMTKKEALLILSNITRKAETFEIMAKLSKELEKEELTSEQKRLIKEMIDKLYNRLKDIDSMEQIAQSIQKVQKTNMSTESLQELISALDQAGFRPADAGKMGKISDQLDEAKKQIANIVMKPGNNVVNSENQIETGLNIAGDGAPGDNSVSDTDTGEIQEAMTDEGYNTEVESQVDESGKGILVDIDEEQKDIEAIVPYRDIYVEYRQVADEAISRKSIPWVYRRHVINYFDAIKPKEKSDGN